MARAYSQDLRDRVLSATAGRSSARGAAERFGIGIKTAIEWVRRARETGETTARRQEQRFVDSRGLTFNKSVHATEQDRPDVLTRRKAWFEGQYGERRRRPWLAQQSPGGARQSRSRGLAASR